MQCISKFFAIDKKEIAYLKFILEGYSGLATLTTISAREGRILLLMAPGAEYELTEIMQMLTEEIKSLKFIEE
jgi:hypothetical protein